MEIRIGTTMSRYEFLRAAGVAITGAALLTRSSRMPSTVLGADRYEYSDDTRVVCDSLGRECEKLDIGSAFLRNEEEYRDPVAPREGHIEIIQRDGEKCFYVKAYEGDENRDENESTSIQNSLDWIARYNTENEKNRISRIILAEGVHYTDGAPIVIDDRHGDIIIEGETQGATIIDAENRSRAIFIDGGEKRDDSYHVKIKGLKIKNGNAGARAFQTNLARTDRSYSVWNNVDGGALVAVGKVSFDIENCTFQDCFSVICGAAVSIDTGLSANTVSTIRNCRFDNCGMEESGMGTGSGIDILSGNVDIIRCSFSNMNPGNTVDNNGIICAFENSITRIKDCTFDLSDRVQVVIAYARNPSDVGIMEILSGNRILLPREMKREDVEIRELLRNNIQPGPSKEQVDVLSAEYNFSWDPENGDYADSIRRINPGITGGRGYLLRRHLPVKMLRELFAGVNLYRLPISGEGMPIFIHSSKVRDIFEFVEN